MTATDVAVCAEGVWKKFRRGEHHDSLRDLLPALAKRMFRRGPSRSDLGADDFWAVQDVNFEVRKGEALGIIGPNGAGKSTMLKLLTRILRPNRGSCWVEGRVGALIEVAAGFHPDLTGRENIYLQGAILGMKTAEVSKRLPDIIEFAGVGPFVDTPVKRYSSGMNARLGFSIAAHLDPDVLLIDEILSVGDMEFQQKCVARMKKFKQDGVAIVFVSHNMQAVADLCDRAVFLSGSVMAQGKTADVVATYFESVQGGHANVTGGEVEIGSVTLRSNGGQPVDTVTPGSALALKVTYSARETFSDITFGLLLHRSTDGLVVYDGNFKDLEVGVAGLTKGQKLSLTFRLRAHLTRGQYHFECHVFHGPTGRFLGRLSPAAMLRVDEMRTFSGVADLDVHVSRELSER